LAVKSLLYATFLFAGMMVFLLFKEPYTLKGLDENEKAKPEIELFQARNFQIKESGVESIVNASRVERYRGYDKLYVIDAVHLTKEKLKGVLTSNEAILKEGIILFLKNSQYVREDGVRLVGEAIYYDTKNETLSSDKPFIFTQSQSRSNGLSFVYQMKEGTISANGIHSFIEVGKKKK